MALYDDLGVVTRLDGDAGTISVLLLNEGGDSSTASPDAYSDLENDDARMVSRAAADVSKAFPEPRSNDDPSDPADRAPPSPSGAAKAARHAIPVDEYSAQIMSRIERAWVRPLSDLEGTFHCAAHIVQTPQGEVRDIVLEQCNGDPAWRDSITRAIHHAAPLPAAPSEAAFRSVLTLNFQAQPLSPALLAEMLSVAQELSPVERRGNTLKPTDVHPIPNPGPRREVSTGRRR